MLTVEGQKIKRGGELVGYIEAPYIKNEEGAKLGYWEGTSIYNTDGKKLAYVEGHNLYSYESRSSYVDLDKVNKELENVVLPEIAKCAIYQLIVV